LHSRESRNVRVKGHFYDAMFFRAEQDLPESPASARCDRDGAAKAPG